MPLIYYKSMPGAEVALWKTGEEISFFKEKLHQQGFPTHEGLRIAHPEKQLQWYASRYLLSTLYPGAIPLYNDRKPYLFNGPFISLSHSKNIVAVQVSEFKSGIDIQWPDPKLKIISNRFLAKNDIQNIETDNEIEALSIIWTIKEAVFKYYGTAMPFKKIEIENYNKNQKTALATAHRNGTEELHKLQVDFVEGMSLAFIRE